MHDWKREGGLLEGMITGLQIEWAVCLRKVVGLEKGRSKKGC